MLQIILAVAAIILFFLNIASFFAGVTYRKKIAEAEFGSAEEKAKSIVDQAEKDAKARKREIMLEAKEENQKLRSVLDAEIKDRRRELRSQEQS